MEKYLSSRRGKSLIGFIVEYLTLVKIRAELFLLSFFIIVQTMEDFYFVLSVNV